MDELRVDGSVSKGEEAVYFEGSPRIRGEMGRVLKWGVLGTVFVAGPVVYGVYGRWGWPSGWVTAGLMLMGVVMWGVPWLRARSVRYRITNYRIDYERGMLGKRIDTLELWHVEDISFRQSLVGRILNVGTIVVVSHDETTPELVLGGVPSPRPLFEMLKERVIAVKRERGVIKMDVG